MISWTILRVLVSTANLSTSVCLPQNFFSSCLFLFLIAFSTGCWPFWGAYLLLFLRRNLLKLSLSAVFLFFEVLASLDTPGERRDLLYGRFCSIFWPKADDCFWSLSEGSGYVSSRFCISEFGWLKNPSERSSSFNLAAVPSETS